MAHAVNTTDPSSSWLDSSRTVSAMGDVIECQNQLVTTRLPSGGLRWWFICPLVTNGQGCLAKGEEALPSTGRPVFRLPAVL